MKIILVRHGESESNAGLTKEKNSPLTKIGRLQAQHLGKRLKEDGISEIYTSNMKRAKQTGAIISKIIRVPIKGSFEELNEYEAKHIRNFLPRTLNIRARKLRKLMRNIAKEREEDKTILIAAHGNTNRIILSHLLGIPLRRQMFRLRQYNTAVNILSWSKNHKNWALYSMNDVNHLPRKLIGIEG